MSLAAIVRRFGVEPRRVRLIGRRHNAHWAVTAKTGRYVLRRYGWNAPLASVLWEHEALRLASARGLPVAVPLGAPVAADGALYDLFAFLPGRPRRTNSDADYRRDGRLAADIALRFAGAALPQRPGRIAAADAASGPWGHAARRAALLAHIRDAALTDLLERQADTVIAELTRLGARDFPRAVIHGDLIAGNQLCSRGVLTGLIDFDASRLDARAAEVAQTRRGHHDAVVDGYNAVAPLSSEEIAALPWLWQADILHNAAAYLAHFGQAIRRADFAWAEAQFRKTVPYKKQPG